MNMKDSIMTPTAGHRRMPSHQASSNSCSTSTRRQTRSRSCCLASTALLVACSVLHCAPSTNAFVIPTPLASTASVTPSASLALRTFSRQRIASPADSSSALFNWWFGGTEGNEANVDGDSCELVAVRIENTSRNSRRIAGEIIVVDTPVDDVWAILTDYDRLSIHVPNLIESKVVGSSPGSVGSNGDGAFKCRLFQKGAQKIIGFDFSASVTMDMTESIVSQGSAEDSPFVPEDRRIGFKCVDSQFFKEFDGEWRVTERINAATHTPETVVSYTVDVRPKGPVPVAALEWRIREDVPTNLRAVKASAMRVGRAGVEAARTGNVAGTRKQLMVAIPGVRERMPKREDADARFFPVPIMADWDRDETMAKYL